MPAGAPSLSEACASWEPRLSLAGACAGCAHAGPCTWPTSCPWASSPVPVSGAGCWGQEGAWVPLGKALAFTSVLSTTCWPCLSGGVQPSGPRPAVSRWGARPVLPGLLPGTRGSRPLRARALLSRTCCLVFGAPRPRSFLGARPEPARYRKHHEWVSEGFACRALVPVGHCTSSNGVSLLLSSPLPVSIVIPHTGPATTPKRTSPLRQAHPRCGAAVPLPVPRPPRPPPLTLCPSHARPPPRPRPHRRLPVSVGLSPAGPAHRWLARHSRFRVWSVSRGITSSRSTRVVASVGVHSFLRLSHSSPFTGHWGYFRLSAVANDAANICSLLFSFFQTPSSGIAGPHGDSTFSFLRSLRAVFHRRRSILHPRQPCTRAPISPHLFCFCF